jgi:hypothetical protein
VNGWFLLALGGGALALLGGGALVGYRHLLKSSTADRYGIDNSPDSDDIVRRLMWLVQQEGPLLELVRELYPSAHITSAYRNAAVNDLVGGSPTSAHTQGRALDVGGIGSHRDIEGAARHVRDTLHRLPAAPKRVLAEYSHLHVTYYDPLGTVDATSGDTAFRTQTASNPRRFAALV